MKTIYQKIAKEIGLNEYTLMLVNTPEVSEYEKAMAVRLNDFINKLARIR